MDAYAARAANRLVGNPDGAALLELTLAGPTLRFETRARVAWVGGDVEAAIDGRPAAGERSHDLAAGARLELGRARGGARAWLAVAGGVDVATCLGSRATDLAAGFGGLAGRALVAGDLLAVGCAAPTPPRALAPELLRELARRELRVLAGPDAFELDAQGLPAALAGDLRVSARSDRRGVRFERAAPARGGGGELRSQGVLFGTIQLPPAGEPIALGVDAPVTGGYPWVAQVIEADRGRLAHFPPRALVRFAAVEWATAVEATQRLERLLEAAVEEIRS